MAQEPMLLGSHRLEMDGDWGLLELSGFGRQYVQLYSFLYVLESTGAEPEPDEATLHPFRAFPWAGGWSAVDFFDSLRVAVPPTHRPRIASIRYSSPGYIELTLAVAVALNLRKIVDHVCSSVERIHDTYNALYRGAQERKLLKLDVRRRQLVLDREQLQFAEEATNALLRMMNLGPLSAFFRLTANPVARMKILLAVYRRLRRLVKLRNSGQIRF